MNTLKYGFIGTAFFATIIGLWIWQPILMACIIGGSIAILAFCLIAAVTEEILT